MVRLLGILVALAALVHASPALAVDYAPAPPSGWHISQLSEPAWSYGPRFQDGVVVVSTGPADSRAFQAHCDVYRLRDEVSPGDSGAPATTVLRDCFQGVLFALDQGVILYGTQRPGTELDDQILDLYLRDLGSGAVTGLPLPTDLELNPNGPPRIDAGRVVWSQFGFQHEPEVMLYDIATGTAKKLSQGAEAQGAPDIDGDDVVWQAWNGVVHRVLYHNLSTGITRELAAGIPWTAALGPQVANGRVVWVTHEWIAPDDDRESLYLADLAAGTTQLVFSTPGSIEAALDGDLLVTSTRIGDEPLELVVRDLAAGTTRVLGDSLAPPLSFSVRDGMDAWEDVAPLPDDQGYLNRLLVYDSATGETVELAEGHGLWQPLVDRGRVLFVELVDSESSRLWLAEKEGTPLYDYYLDVAATDPYQEAILDFSERGLVSGYLTGTFRMFHPAYPLFRAQLAKILSNSLGLSVNEELTPSIPFTDLGPDDPGNLYPHEYVAAVGRAGLMQGYGANSFGPWNRLTRAQMVTVIVRALRALAPQSLETPPEGYVGSVLGVPAAHAENLRMAEFNGLLDGLQGFGPTWDVNDFARRGEVVQMLYEVQGAAE